MMLEHVCISSENFSAELERYLGDTLHISVHIAAAKFPGNLPGFLNRIYDFYEAAIGGQRCVIIAAGDQGATPSDVAKHVHLVTKAVGTIVIYSARSVSSHNRSRFIAQGVPFIVPGNQLYIPQLALDLREHFRAPRTRSGEHLSPAAQAVLFHHLLRLDEGEATPSALAGQLRYSAMTIGRAFDDLVAFGLAKTRKRGRERLLRFKGERRELLEGARTLLQSPVRSVKFVCCKRRPVEMKLAGESALAHLTDLNPPRIESFAIAASEWKVLSKTDLQEVEPYAAEFALETWSYDPAGLSDTPIVDRLSLYAQFWDHRDERVSMAAESLAKAIL